MRNPVHWEARYWIEGRGRATAADCRILDVTRVGAGIVFIGTGSPAEVSDRIVIEIVKMAGTSVMLTLRGTVRDVTSPSDDDVRLGVSLTFDGPYEQRIAQTLFAD